MSYRQCVLQREENGSKFTTTSYIPSKLAKVGRNIEIKENDTWTAWTVSSASDTEISDELAKQVDQKSHDGWGSLDMPRRRGKSKKNVD